MDVAEHDQLFQRFARARDARALAAFYDRAAPELLLVATHLGAASADAEDLVQATFLAAIEKVDTYDPGRPAMPWLIGILVNQARRARRRRDPPPDGAHLDHDDALDPARAAEDAELAEHLASRLRALPSGYREVMTLRFVHGLMPLQIAHALGVAPDTVKTRLRRGTEMLRRALPVGFATALATVLAPARGLAAVREIVLAAAESYGRHGLPLGLAGLWRTPWQGAAIAGVLALTAGLVWATIAAPVAPADLGAPPPGSASASASRGEAPATETSSASPVPAVREPVTAPTGTATGRLRITVRYDDSTPAPSVHVALTPRAGADPLLRRTWLVTDAEGTADGEVAVGAYAVDVDRGGSAAATVVAGADNTAQVRIPPGVRLRGRVHAAGRAVANAAVWLSFDGRPDEGRCVAASDDTGAFALRDVATGRTFSVFVPGHVPDPLRSVDAPVGAVQEVDVDIAELRSSTAIAGRVVDDRGEPIAGARLQLGRRLPHFAHASSGMGRDALVPPIELTTRSDGGFAHQGFVVFDRVLEVWVRAPGFAIHYEAVSFASERAREVTLVLAPGATVSGRVTTPDGAPAVGARVTARSGKVEDWEHAPRWAQVEALVGDDGAFSLPGLAPGRVWLAARGAHGTRASTVLDTATSATWDAALAPPVAIEGVVRDEQGAGVAGVQVRARAGKDREEPPAATTDAAGSFTIADCDAQPHTLAVFAPATAWPGALASRAGVIPGRLAQVLVVPRAALDGGWLSGRVVDENGVPLAARIAVGHLRDGHAFATNDPVSGRFRVGPLPRFAGTWHLLVQDDARHDLARGGLQLPANGDLELGDLVPRAGGRVHVQVGDPPSADGPAAHAAVQIGLQDGLPVASVPLRAGKGVSRPLPPGDYVVHFLGEDVAQSATRISLRSGADEHVVLRPPAAFARTFTFAVAVDDDQAVLELRWLDAAGTLLCVDRVQTDGSGPMRHRQAFAAGAYRLQALTHAGQRADVAFEAGPGFDGEPIAVQLR